MLYLILKIAQSKFDIVNGGTLQNIILGAKQPSCPPDTGTLRQIQEFALTADPPDLEKGLEERSHHPP